MKFPVTPIKGSPALEMMRGVEDEKFTCKEQTVTATGTQSSSVPSGMQELTENGLRKSCETGARRTGDPVAESLWTLNSGSSSGSQQRLFPGMKMGKIYKSKTLSWTLIVLGISLVSLWLCAVAYFFNFSNLKPSSAAWTELPPGQEERVTNLRPIIGVLSQEYKYYSDNARPKQSYIAASYVKFLEGAGARVVPIMINGTADYVRNVFKSVNGILFPGGAVPLDVSKYGQVGRLLLQLAIEANDKEDYFPVWGTCLGFEFMLFTGAGSQELRANCGANNVKDRLKFTEAASSSRLFGTARRSLINILATKEVTVNFHHFCITAENFTRFGLDDKYRILSMNYDAQSGLQYISAVEAKQYPFYAVQFHPEKNLYEWTTKENIPHSPDAIEAAQYFANFFVNEARKNHHKFASLTEENEHLIYNYVPTFSGEKSTFEQLYLFPME